MVPLDAQAPGVGVRGLPEQREGEAPGVAVGRPRAAFAQHVLEDAHAVELRQAGGRQERREQVHRG